METWQSVITLVMLLVKATIIFFALMVFIPFISLSSLSRNLLLMIGWVNLGNGENFYD